MSACSLPGDDRNSYISIPPELAAAVLSERDHLNFASYMILRSYDSRESHGRGFLDRTTAIAAIEDGRGLSRRQSQRLLHSGEGLYWKSEGNRVWLFSLSKVTRRLGVNRLSRAHRIPITDFQEGVGSLRSTLTATMYRTDDAGVPTARRWIAEHTGVPAVTQRRHDSIYGHVDRVQSVTIEFARLGLRSSEMPEDLRTYGFFVGRKGALMRRHPDIRRSVTHRVGSKTMSRRVNGEMRLGTRPATKARGQRQPAAYFPMERRGGISGWLKSKLALGKRSAASTVSHPFLNYAAVQVRTLRGRLRWEAIRENDDVFGVRSERG